MNDDIRYRPDVDGLRAVAVSAVVAFHVDPSLIPAGYLGVDIFFVVSGFVITRALLREYQSTSRLDLVAFWARRVRRLAPALLLVLGAVLAVAPFVLERVSGETGILVRSALASLVFCLNHFLIGRAGDYFGEYAEHNPLLHLWSLSVEEQFYLTWPILMLLLLRWGNRGVLVVISIMTVAGLLFWMHTAAQDPVQAFYLMPTRAWQLLSGAVVAVWLHRANPDSGTVPGKFGGTFGVVLVISGLFAPTAQAAGGRELALFLVTIGTALVVLSGSSNSSSSVTRALSAPVLTYVGKISYPLYLWHWPLLAMSRSTRLYESNRLIDVIFVVIAIGLAIFTHEVVEKGLWRWQHRFSKRRLLGNGLVGALVIGFSGLALGSWVRFGWGYSDQERQLDFVRTDRADTGCMFAEVPSVVQLDACFPKRHKTSILLWGDSHAEHWAPAMQELGKLNGVDVGVVTMNGCRPLVAEARGGACGTFNNLVISQIQTWRASRGLVGVVLASRWADGMGVRPPSIADEASEIGKGFYDNRARSREQALSLLGSSLRSRLSSLTLDNLRVLVVMTSPIQRFSAHHCLSRLTAGECGLPRQVIDEFSADVDQVLTETVSENVAVRAVSTKAFMCDQFTCPVQFEGVVAYSDDDHVTATFSRLSAKHFADDFSWLTSITIGQVGHAN